MSRIFGCWHLDARPVSGLDVERCLAQLSPAGPDAIEFSLDAAFALGRTPACNGRDRVSRKPAPAAGHSIAAFAGRLDNRAALSRSVSMDGDCRASDLIAAAYHRFGDAFVDHFEGDVSLAVFDPLRRRLLLARDRLGLRPLCYARSGPAFLFGSDAKALLTYPGMTAAPDEAALADFLLYFPAADAATRTMFRGVHAVAPGHLLIATADGIALRRYFEFDTRRQTRLGTFRDYAAALDDVFTAAVRRRVRSERPIAVSVSGGLDSSYILCTAQRLVRREPGLAPAVFGFHHEAPPGTPSDERRFVDVLERESGARIERIPERVGFLDRAAEDVWCSESPRIDRLAAQGGDLRTRARDAGAGRLLTGHWGDQLLSDSDYLGDLFLSGRWRTLRRHADAWRVPPRRLAGRLARDLVARHAPGALLSPLRVLRAADGAWRAPWFTPRFRRVLRERFAAARPPFSGSTYHARAILRQSRLPYHLHCMEWNVRLGAGDGLEVAFPYLDCELVQFLMSIPGDMQSHDGVPRALMREAMRGTVPDAIVRRRDKGEFTHLGRQSLERDFAAVRQLLGPASVAVTLGYLDGRETWKQLEAWRTAMRDADSVYASRLTDLCGLELLLRRFFAESEPHPVPRTRASW